MDLTYEITVLCIVAFMAGFVDAIAGGGGLRTLKGKIIYSVALPMVICNAFGGYLEQGLLSREVITLLGYFSWQLFA
jgi:hypothetical protein